MEMYKTCFCVERLNIINMPVLRKRIYKFKTLISVYTFNAIVIRILILRTGQSSFKFYMGKIILHFKCSEKNSEENYKLLLCKRQCQENEKRRHRDSLVAQWLRICLPMQGTRVRALVWEDPTCHGATGPVSHNY